MPDRETELVAVICRPGEDAAITKIPAGKDYEAIGKTVGGLFCEVRLRPGIVAYVHDRGLWEGLPWNRRVGPEVFLAGTILVMGYDVTGESRSLAPDEQTFVLWLLNHRAERLDHKKASSIAELESWLKHKAVRVFEIKEDGTQIEICATCRRQLKPEDDGYCPYCTIRKES